MSDSYTSRYYDAMAAGASRSAEVIVPYLMEWIDPGSVVDVGCGSGAWLEAFVAHGIHDIQGIDGDHIDPKSLAFSRDRFHAQDLGQPVRLDRGFDLALCLEVAEHLPPENGETLVDSLTRLSPIVLFSAAVPHQGGAGHVNLQWPSYWAERFRERGYRAIDCLRHRVWNDPRVCWWYAQNILLYASTGALDRHPGLWKEHRRRGVDEPLSLVHPDLLRECVEWGLRYYEMVES